MSSENTETRILQMQLENKDFENGVRQTIKSLESLEEKLELKNAGNGFEKVSAAANSVQMSHLESGLDKVTSKFTLMGQIGLQVLNRISTVVVDTGEKILRAATIQPMIDGWGEFEMKTNSVQTILGGIRHQFEDQPTAINAISNALNELNEYADKTIYNFAQMTENVGKFTNQGISLEESTNAIKGIANWAAAVGANPAQMSRAMYNISQSLGTGSMQLIDWRSIRFANMATPEVKKLFVEVAKKMGTLGADGMVQVSKNVTVDALEDFEGSLKGRWLTNEVMTEAFGIYAKSFTEEELIAKYGEELGRQFYEMGVYAEEAATKVRTFSQLMGVLQESMGSGWANTFDILLGGFEKQTEFLTAIKDRIEAIINFQTEDRNAWLQSFSDIGGIQVFHDIVLKTLDVLSDFYWVFSDVAALVLNPFGDSVFNMSDGIFGPRQEGYTEMKSTWEGVKGIFDDISATLDNFRRWLYTPDEKSGRSPIHNLANALSGVAGVAGIAWQALTGFGKVVFRIFKRFEPLVSSVLDLLGQIGGAIYNVFFNLTGKQSLEQLFDNIGNAIEPVIGFVVDFAAAVVDLIHSFLGIDKAADDWTVLSERIDAFWNIFKYDPNLTFADNLKNSLKNAMVAIFGKDTADSMIKAWDENVAPVLENISNFFTAAFADLNRVLEGLRSASDADYSQAEGFGDKFSLFLNSFLGGYYGEDQKSAEEAYNNIFGIYENIVTYYDEHVAPHVQKLTDIFTKDLPVLNATIFNFLFGHEVTGKQGNKWREGGLLQEIQGYFEGDQWAEVSEKIKSWAETAAKEIELAWNNVSNFIFGHEITGKQGNKWREGGIIQGIQGYFESDQWNTIATTITSWADTIIHEIELAWNNIVNFLFGHEVTGKQGNKWRQGGLFQGIQDFFGGDVIKAIEDFFLGEVTGTDKFGNEYRHNGIFEVLRLSFEQNVIPAINSVYDWITTEGQKAWDGIMDFLFGKEVEKKDGTKFRLGGAYDDAIRFLTPVWDWIQEKGDLLYNYLTTHDFQEMWRDLNHLLFGYTEEIVETQGLNRQKKFVQHDGIMTPIVEMLRPISDGFERIKLWAIDKLDKVDWGGIWESIGKFFNGYDEISVEYDKATSAPIFKHVHHEGAFERIVNFFDGIITYFQSPEFQAFIESIKTFYHTYIEPVINWLGGLGGTLMTALTDVFSGKGFGAFGNVGNYISEGFNNLMGNIFPEGFSLDGILGGLLGGNGDAKSAEKAAESGGGGILDAVLGLFLGEADAAGAEGSAIEDVANGIIADLTQTEKAVDGTVNKQVDASNSILGSVSKLMPYIAGAGGIALVGKVGDLVTGITGNRKPTIIEQVGSLLRSFGEVFKGLGILVGAAALAESISPGALDKIFERITNLLTTVFTWITVIAGGGKLLDVASDVGGSFLVNKIFGGNGSEVLESLNFDSVSQIISSIGQGLNGIFSALQTLFNLAWEVAFTDVLLGVDKDTGQYNFDKKLDRVLGFIGKVLGTILGSSWWLELANIVNSAASSGFTQLFGKQAKIESLASIMGGIGNMISGLGDGIAAIMTASIIPSILNVDTSKIVDLINAVFTGLKTLSLITEIGALTSKLGDRTGWKAFEALAGAGGGLAVALGAIGTVAGFLATWYLGIVEEHLTTMAPALYTFISNLTGALELIGSLESTKLDSAETVLSKDLPRLLGYINSEKLGFDKATIDDVGQTIRDFGNRVNTGVSSLAKAKDIFDKYNTGGNDFPVEFFREMTEALQYLQNDDIEELYDNVFGQGGFFVGDNGAEERKINGLSTFFSTMGSLGSVVTEYSEFDGFTNKSGTRLESRKQGLDSFQDAFSGIQQTFHSLMDDITKDNFDSDKLNDLGDFLKKISDAAYTFSKTFIYKSGSTVLFEQTSPITQFAGWLQTMGSGVRQLNDSLKTNGVYDIDYTQIESALKSLQPMADIEKTLYEYSTVTTDAFGHRSRDWMGNTKAWADSVIPEMSRIGEGLHNMASVIKPEDVASLTSASGALTALSTFMTQDLYTNIQGMTTDQIGAYATAFGSLKNSLLIPETGGSNIADILEQVMTATGGKEVKMQIVPIVDDSKMGSQLPEGMEMENTYSRMITMQLNMNDVVNVKVDATQISDIVTANNETKAEVSSLARAISQMKILVPPGSGGGSRSTSRSVIAYPLVADQQPPWDNP